MPQVRVQTTSKVLKSRLQYEMMMRAGELEAAVIIGRRSSGDFHVLGQSMTLEEITQALLAAAAGVQHAAEREVAEGRREAKVEPQVAHAYRMATMDDGVEEFERLVESDLLEHAVVLCAVSEPGKPFKLISLGADMRDVAHLLREAVASYRGITGRDP